jgi:hypothetical protein
MPGSTPAHAAAGHRGWAASFFGRSATCTGRRRCLSPSPAVWRRAITPVILLRKEG